MTVVVTDHHEVPFEEDENGERRYILPPADAVVNPKQKDCSYPFPGLCGAAVAWKLIQTMEAKAGIPKEHSFRFLEFVAIATIGDVMDLQGENRIFVKAGLRALHKTQNLGLQELIRVQGIEAENVTPYHIGFVLGPCINASGRLDTAEHSLKLLCAKTREEAAKLAGDLKDLNESRKELTRRVRRKQSSSWKPPRCRTTKSRRLSAGLPREPCRNHRRSPAGALPQTILRTHQK